MSVLHLGCGREPLPEWLNVDGEVRLDIDPNEAPDVVASVLDVGPIGPFDVVYSSHVLEHVYPHEVKTALRESKRVLKDGGVAVHIVPDLEDIRPTDEVVYQSPAGPVTGHDMFYGMASMIELRPYMAHKTGFVRDSLEREMLDAGFSTVMVRRWDGLNLIALGVK